MRRETQCRKEEKKYNRKRKEKKKKVEKSTNLSTIVGFFWRAGRGPHVTPSLTQSKKKY
jgi:hypothetical protein